MRHGQWRIRIAEHDESYYHLTALGAVAMPVGASHHWATMAPHTAAIRSVGATSKGAVFDEFGGIRRVHLTPGGEEA